jgi:hypothetical protein
MNKKIIPIASIVLVMVLGIVIYLVGPSVATKDSTILKDQEVEGLTFTNADLNVDKGISTLSVSVTNTNKEAYSLNYIEIVVKDEKDNSDTLIGYIGETIESNETKVITASIDKDITESKSLEYVINK